MQTSTAKQIVVNTVFVSGIVTAWFHGYVQFVFSHDISHLSYVISVILVMALAAALSGRYSHLESVKEWLVTMGLIGNVVGFIIMLQGIDVNGLGTAEGVRAIGANMLSGMGVAFCSTLVGAIGAIWVSVIAWVVGVDGKATIVVNNNVSGK